MHLKVGAPLSQVGHQLVQRPRPPSLRSSRLPRRRLVRRQGLGRPKGRRRECRHLLHGVRAQQPVPRVQLASGSRLIAMLVVEFDAPATLDPPS